MDISRIYTASPPAICSQACGICLQAKQAAVKTSMIVMTCVSDLAQAESDGSSDPARVLREYSTRLRQALQKARYHQVQHVRDAASEALALLATLVPEQKVSQRSRPVLSGAPAQRKRSMASRKGPWLHEQRAALPLSGEVPMSPSMRERAEYGQHGSPKLRSRSGR
jgi:ABC-type transporter Mla MlaB component